MNRKAHWENVYQSKDHTKVGWYQPSAVTSLKIIDHLAISSDAALIDVGAGASNLVDALISKGFIDITLLDLSSEALAVVKERLGEKRTIPRYLIDDITTASLPRRYDLWHDRAAFHFLSTEDEQQAYVGTMYESLRCGGYAIIGTFAVDGPDSCSELKVQQYDEARMKSVMQGQFTIEKTVEEIHKTPGGTAQKFCYFVLKSNKTKKTEVTV